jgi:protoporphyrinogen oxidase
MILKLSSHLDLTKTVHIYGAGIAGLLMAYQLKKKAIPFKIYESEKRVGGKIQTRITEFGLI